MVNLWTVGKTCRTTEPQTHAVRKKGFRIQRAEGSLYIFYKQGLHYTKTELRSARRTPTSTSCLIKLLIDMCITYVCVNRTFKICWASAIFELIEWSSVEWNWVPSQKRAQVGGDTWHHYDHSTKKNFQEYPKLLCRVWSHPLLTILHCSLPLWILISSSSSQWTPSVLAAR